MAASTKVLTAGGAKVSTVAEGAIATAPAPVEPQGITTEAAANADTEARNPALLEFSIGTNTFVIDFEVDFGMAFWCQHGTEMLSNSCPKTLKIFENLGHHLIEFAI